MRHPGISAEQYVGFYVSEPPLYDVLILHLVHLVEVQIAEDG